MWHWTFTCSSVCKLLVIVWCISLIASCKSCCLLGRVFLWYKSTLWNMHLFLRAYIHIDISCSRRMFSDWEWYLLLDLHMGKSLLILSHHEVNIYNIRNGLFYECDTVDKSVITVIPNGDWTSTVLKSGNLMTTRITQKSLGRLCTIMCVVDQS